MLLSEFIERTSCTPDIGEYKYIEDSYYEFDGDKNEFCKWWLKAKRSGEWGKELRLRQRLDTVTSSLNETIIEKESELEFFIKENSAHAKLARILKATGKENNEAIKIKLFSEPTSRRFENVAVKYIDNGEFDFINVIEKSGWITSFRISDIEMFSRR